MFALLLYFFQYNIKIDNMYLFFFYLLKILLLYHYKTFIYFKYEC
jgi:hypothetical protein